MLNQNVQLLELRKLEEIVVMIIITGDYIT